MTGQSGEVLVNRNVPNGAEPILKVIGGLPPGTPADRMIEVIRPLVSALSQDGRNAPETAGTH